MKKVKKKVWLISIIIAIILVATSITLLILFNEDKTTSLTILEKRWIEDNKNKIIDLGITYDIPIYSKSQDDVLFKFMSELEKNTGLEFNKVPHTISQEVKEEYYFGIVNELPTEPYILFDSTNYVLLSKTPVASSNRIIGVLKNDLESAKYYIENETFKDFESVDLMITAYKAGTITSLVLPYETYLDSILKLDDTVIEKKITEMKQFYILKLSKNNKKLNSIIKKYYEKWSKDNKEKLYNNIFIDMYYSAKSISQQQTNQLNSKNYVYGYVDNLPYETVIDNKMYGIISQYLKEFSNITDVEFEFKSYKSIDDLKKALSDKKVDIAFGYYNIDSDNIIKTIDIGNINYVVLTGNNSPIIVNSVKSLRGKEVLIIKDSGLKDYLTENTTVTLKEFNTLKALLEGKNKDSIIVLDDNTYEYYRDKVLDEYQVVYRGTSSLTYNFLISNINNNKLFEELFNYYLSFTDENTKRDGYNLLLNEKVLMKKSEKKYLGYSLVLIVILLAIIAKVLRTGKINKQNKREEKIRYVDMLTSLKNRNYLNSHMSEWNNNTVYPQAIIIIDLNNIKYINDNYGYEEGDNVIGMAANILINTQLENTDIIRSDGNEFLIYMVGYDDKKVITYMRKLYKEFQQLPHEFGAALGYSMIEDDIKTIDDAINEATLDMRKNKETME